MKTKMMRTVYVTLLVMFFTGSIFAQVGINNTGDNPDNSAMLDVKSTTKGMLIPRMDASQRTGINPAATGLLVYQTDAPAGFYYYNGTGWIYLGTGEGGGGHVIDSDGNAYPTIKIGNQEWMAANLRTTHYCNGDAIPNVIGNPEWANLTTGARCYYNLDSATNNLVYGALYNWHAVNDSRKLCPTGWHVPTDADWPNDAEWVTLITYLGGNSVAGGKMKATILWNSPNTGATNTSGFSGLPGGYRNFNGGFYYVREVGYWWSSFEYGTTYAYYRYIYYSFLNIFSNADKKTCGFSVRCIRD